MREIGENSYLNIFSLYLRLLGLCRGFLRFFFFGGGGGGGGCWLLRLLPGFLKTSGKVN